jgi:hypothetical protein
MRTAGATHGATRRVDVMPSQGEYSATDHWPIKAMQWKKFDGKTWVLFGENIEAGS